MQRTFLQCSNIKIKILLIFFRKRLTRFNQTKTKLHPRIFYMSVISYTINKLFANSANGQKSKKKISKKLEKFKCSFHFTLTHAKASNQFSIINTSSTQNTQRITQSFLLFSTLYIWFYNYF